MIKFIDAADIVNQKVLLRVDFNVPFNPDFTVSNDLKIQQSIPTLEFLLKKNNKIILISHLNNPKTRSAEYSLLPVTKHLKKYLPNYEITLVDDFIKDKSIFQNQTNNQIIMLENIRFYPEEKTQDEEFARQMASLADVFVNDAFGVCHRNDTSVVMMPQFLPSYGGLLLKKEIQSISNMIQNPKKPFVAVLGGAKISTKLHLLDRLMDIADYLLVGGGLANTLLAAQNIEVGKSLFEETEKQHSLNLIEQAGRKNTKLLIPLDVIIEKTGKTKKITEVIPEDKIMDIGSETQQQFTNIISQANTIIWNGPMGYFEDPRFKTGTNTVYQAIVNNNKAISIVGGGDTLASIDNQKNINKISHLSTGGGAMLEFIEKGTLPGIEALNV